MRNIKKRAVALILALAVTAGMTNHVMLAETSGQQSNSSPDVTTTPDMTAEKVITISPFAGQWKYFGQKRNFVFDMNFTTSDDNPLPEGVTLKTEEEKIGIHKFYIEDLRSEEQKKKVTYEVEKDAPTYEVREYKTTAAVEKDVHIYNIEDKREADGNSSVVSGSAGDVTKSTMRKNVEAPKGYLISPTLEGEDISWSTSMEVELKEGENTFTYYLRSNQRDESRKAIDQTPKSVTLKADWTAPEISSLLGGDNSTDVSSGGQITSNEPGTFYYVVVPENHAELTQADIETNVSSHYGIVGFGRVDGTTKATDFSFRGLMANRNYVIYSYMEDDAGNCSPVRKSDVFATDLMALTGSVEITGTMAVDQVLTAKENLDCVATGQLSYQWYRIKNNEDTSSVDEVWDETGGADEDDLEAEEDEEDEDEEDDTIELANVPKLSETDDVTTIDGATLISDATQATYKVTKDDIGYRLICSVRAEKYSGYIAGESNTFVPKLLPEYAIPTMASVNYSPKLKLSSFVLPQQWSWVDSGITPVYGNSGYRAKFVPADTQHYKSVIVRVKIPVKKRTLKKSMIAVQKKRAYTGTAIKNNFYVEDADDMLEQGIDFKVTYRHNKKPGRASITFRGIGNYRGTVKVTYTIKKRSVKSLSYQYNKTRTYNGKLRTADVLIKNGKVRLKKDVDYSIVYKNNKEMGRASITICGKGNYVGKKVLHFDIIPAKPKISKAGKTGKTMKLKFKGDILTKGFFVYISTSKTFSKKKTSEYKLSGDSFNLKNMAKGTYFIRIKGYGVKKGKLYISGYSKTRKITIKK